MKKNFFKVLLMASFVSLLVFLGGCGKSAQESFIEGVNISKEKATYSYEMSIPEFEVDSEGTNDAYTGMIISQLKAINVKGEMTTDTTKNNAFEMKMNLSVMGQKIPFEMKGDASKQYISTNYITGIYGIMSSYVGMGSDLTDSDQMAKLKNKYIDAAELMSESLPNEAKTPEEKKMEKFSKELQTELQDYLKKIDKDRFKKEKDDITLTLNKKDFTALINIIQKKMTSKEYKDLFPEVQEQKISQADIAEAMKDVKKLDIAITVNAKAKTQNVNFTTHIADGSDSIKLKLNMKMKEEKFKGTPKMPTKDELITSEQLQEAMNGLDGETVTQ